MDDLVTDEMVETAHAVIDREIGAECPTPSECAACDAHQATTAILEAVAPLIAAAALRDAADWLDDMARGHRETAYLGAGRDLIARLRARAADWVVPPIQVCGPGLEEFGSNSSLRDRIARAIAGADSGLHGVKPCAVCQTGDTNQPCDDCLTMADAVIAALGLREVHTIAWDGEPSMSGRPHRRSAGTESPPGTLRELLGNAAWVRNKPGARIERRWVTEWEATP